MIGNLSAHEIGLLAAVMLASAVEFVEAFTIVLAMGLTRDWRSTLAGTAAALVVLAGRRGRRRLRPRHLVPGGAPAARRSEGCC